MAFGRRAFKGSFKSKRYTPYRSTSRKRYPPAKRRRMSKSTYRFKPKSEDALRIQGTQTIRRQGPYRRPGYQPLIKGSGHRAESYYQWFSSLATPANNPVTIAISNFGFNYKVQSGTIVTQTALTGFDAYFQNSQNAPFGVTKVFQKGCKIKLRITNNNEIACKYRICFVKKRQYKIGTLPGQWNSDVNRPIATRHWKVISMAQGIVEPLTMTDAGAANGITVTEKNFYIPINKWRYTNTGDPASTGDQWQTQAYGPDQTIYMMIDTEDTSSVGSSLSFVCWINDYFSTVETTQT